MRNAAAGWSGEGLARRFAALHAALHLHQPLWRPQAFQHPVLPWEVSLPALSARLRALDCERAGALAEDDAALVELLREDIPELPALHAALALPSIAAEALPALREAVGVPGRKWSQIKAFAGCVPAHVNPLLEWCSGKSHLGRMLARLQGREAIALEWNEALVAEGAMLARRENVAIRFHCVDVLQAAAASLLRREHDVVALHACGELHLQLLRNCAERQPRLLMLAPCCYQLIPDECYRPLSRQARADDLRLTTTDLHTAVRDSVTSPRRVREQRKTLQAWRLGFDGWRRTIQNGDSYLPTPSLPLSILNEGFESFFRIQAAHAGMTIPATLDYAACEAAGWQRLRDATALDLPRIAFRRPLELWLVLDRALYLQEHGYDVEIGTFCERALTPRNIMIRARRCADQDSPISE